METKEITKQMKIKKPKQKKHKYKNNTLFAKLCMAPSILGVLTFFIVPFFAVIYYSVLDNPISKEFVWLDNFKSIVTNTAFLTAAKNTVVLALITVPPAVVLSMLLAMLMESKIPGKSALRSIFLSPVMVPAASVVLVWQVVFHYNGTFNSWLAQWFRRRACGLAQIKILSADNSTAVPLEKSRLQHDTFHVGTGRNAP